MTIHEIWGIPAPLSVVFLPVTMPCSLRRKFNLGNRDDKHLTGSRCPHFFCIRISDALVAFSKPSKIACRSRVYTETIVTCLVAANSGLGLEFKQVTDTQLAANPDCCVASMHEGMHHLGGICAYCLHSKQVTRSNACALLRRRKPTLLQHKPFPASEHYARLVEPCANTPVSQGARRAKRLEIIYSTERKQTSPTQ